MPLGPRAERLARLLLTSLGEAEARAIVHDLRELAATRPRASRQLYFWWELIKYPVRDAFEGKGGGMGMDGWLQDVRYASRSLIRSPSFTLMALAILATSMGATTAIVSVVKGVLLDPLPIHEPERVVSLWLRNDDGRRGRMTPGNYLDAAGLTEVFSHAAAFRSETASLDRGGTSVFLRGGAVTPEYFEAMGVVPIAGRSFRAEEGELGGPMVVVLSERVWRDAFGEDPSIVGRAIELDGAGLEVVGVVPAGVYPTAATVSAELPFTADNQDFFVPLRFGENGWSNRRSHILGAVARLAPGVTPETATAALETLSARLRATEPLNASETIITNPFTEEVVGNVRFALLTLLGTVGLVLLIAAVNVGALFVLRANDRLPEVGVRVALGAPRSRLVRQMMIESGVVALAASIAGVVFAGWLVEFMKRLVPYQIPRLSDISVDVDTLVASVALGGAIAVAFGLAPALALWRSGPGPAGRSRGGTQGMAHRRLQSSVVGLQAGLGVVVLVGAALMVRSFNELSSVDTGFRALDTWTMSVPADLPTLTNLVERLRDQPGIAAAAVAYDHPLSRSWGDGFLPEGYEPGPDEPPPGGSLRPFGIGYFETVGIDVVQGRAPDALDLAGDVAYALINESLRDEYFPGTDPIGRRMELPTARRMMGEDAAFFEILGVVRDVRFLGPDQEPGPALYVPLTHFTAGARILLVRGQQPDHDVVAQVRAVADEVAPGVAIQRAQQLRHILSDELARPRFNMMLLVTFGLMGLVLCGLGAYGLVSRVVSARIREIGIRMALGATPGTIARAVLGAALRPMVIGGALGIGASLLLVQLIRALLYGISPADPISFAVSPAFVLLVGLLAAGVPTLRAMAIDPASTLREE